MRVRPDGGTMGEKDQCGRDKQPREEREVNIVLVVEKLCVCVGGGGRGRIREGVTIDITGEENRHKGGEVKGMTKKK